MMYRCLVLGLLLGACAVGDEADIEPSVDDDGTGSDDNGGGGGTTTSYFYRFTGTIPTSGVVPFGGSPYCDYSVELTNIGVDVVMRDTGHFVQGTASHVMTEQPLNGCPYGVAPPTTNIYEYAGAPATPNANNSLSTALEDGEGNYPATTTDLGLFVAGDDTPMANIRWKRVDQPAPLDWEIRINALSLEPATCERGSVLCVGRTEGVLYSCVDGQRMAESKQCAAGCASATACR